MKRRTRAGRKKGAIVRKLRHMPADAALLFEDETVLRLFPVLRLAWALRGEQSKIGITGRNAKRNGPIMARHEK
jgi:hypothetical protein